MTAENEVAKEQINREIDEATSPENMTPEEALEFLEELAADVEAKIDGLRDDLEA